MLSPKSLPHYKTDGRVSSILSYTLCEPGYITQTAQEQETEPVGWRNINKSLRHAHTHDMGLFFHLTGEDAFS